VAVFLIRPPFLRRIIPPSPAGVTFAENVVVESHPRLVGGKKRRDWRDLLSGSLEVAMGLETAHPRVLARMNKKFELRHFEEAAEFLRKEGMAMRAFVLVKPPFMSEEEGLEWAVDNRRNSRLPAARRWFH